MKFIIQRASQYNYLGDEEMTPPCPNGEWHKVTQFEYRVCTKEEATQRFRDNGYVWKDHITKGGKLGCYRVHDTVTMYVMNFKGLNELMAFIKEVAYRVIIEDAHEYDLPTITIYDDYIE